MLHRALILLGSNHEPERNLQDALHALAQQCRVRAVSPVYESPAVGPDPALATGDCYLNAAVLAETERSPELFKIQVLQPIEIFQNRQHGSRTPVSIDLDLMLWDDAVLDYGAKPWHVPHPDVIRYLHAARPLADLAPETIHPEDGRTLAEIAASLDNPQLQLRTDIRLEG
jgi:2-amino-4-hydroxy-6-hydroxymethyldihydropteridine diphosphokinase